MRMAVCFVAIASALVAGCGSDGSGDGGGSAAAGGSGGDSGSSGSGGTGNSGGGGSGGGSSGSDSVLADPPGEGSAPSISPELVALTYIGGSGDQYVREVSISDGIVTARGSGFEITYDGASGTISGDPSMNDDEDFSARPKLPGDPGTAYDDPRIGLTFRVGYRQAGGNLQMPIFRAFDGDERIWILWGHPVQEAMDRQVTADSRCYQAWGMPDGRIGVQCWTDGGNSVLAKDPRDLTVDGFNPAWADGAYQRSAGGMSSMYALVNPADGGSVESGTFMATHVPVLAVDDWGRVIIARTAASRSGGAEAANPFGQSSDANSGFAVLDPTLKDVLSNVRIGGDCSGDGNTQAFGSIAVSDGLLVLGGTTCASDVAVKNAVQDSSGGGQDGLLAIVRLY